ncbi:hypothetical protein EU527_03710 [Candidatus Thorarchaeota archaeon]|nr:MAG: hypothetical protein EU527_03710 [Candidatus Thorarchaeota archaeon]
MKSKNDIDSLIEQLVELVYIELRNSNIRIDWGTANCFATISWNQDFREIKIRCNNITRQWHQAALYGLLSHELSHPLQNLSQCTEMNTDIDVIDRGMGVYLAVERLIIGKYEDHIIKKGKDRYLGYSSIRKLLLDQEIGHLDRLLMEMRLIPTRKIAQNIQHHDLFLIRAADTTSVHVDGLQFSVAGEIKDTDISIIDRDDQSFIYVNHVEIAQIDNDFC